MILDKRKGITQNLVTGTEHGDSSFEFSAFPVISSHHQNLSQVNLKNHNYYSFSLTFSKQH